jgi:pimeloyl-ACP methyl ester carboxylesterase
LIKQEFVPLEAGDFHIARSGAGRLILFLHGFPQCWYAWRHQLADFGRDHLVVAPDMRGYNRSPKFEDTAAHGVESIVRDVAGLADKLGYERFVLVGHDWGGLIAWAFASVHQDRVNRLVVVDAPHPVVFDRVLRTNPVVQEALRFYSLFRSPRAEEVLSRDDFAVMCSWFGDVLTDEDLAVYKDAWRQPGALTGMLNWYRAADAGPPDPERGRPEGNFSCGFPLESLTVRVPTLVIWGESSLLPLSCLDGLEVHVPELSVATLPGAGHWLPEERPDEVNRQIRRFLSH